VAIQPRLAGAVVFGALHSSGGWGWGWLKGVPVAGLMTRTEIIDNARRIVQSVDIPVYCDADTGYGGIQPKRQGNVHFAGEHTAPYIEAGYMNAGVLTGNRAANEVASY